MLFNFFHFYKDRKMTQEATEQPDYLFKICLIGDTKVGKTNYLNRLTRDLYNPDSKPTIGVDFSNKSMEMKGKTVKAQIWNTAGLDQYRAITSAYYRGMIGAILFYDVTDLKSLTSLSKWIDEIDKMADKNVVILLVGNKCESSYREVSTERGKQFAKQHNFLFKEVSAAENINVSESFDKLIRHIVKKLMKNEDKQQRKEKKEKKEKDDVIQSNSILLSASGLRNIVRNDVDYFTFKFGSCEMKMDKFFAQFLSPLVSRVLLSDPTVESAF